MLQKIKSFLSQGNRAQWCVFILFAFTIFIKGVLFHWNCFHSVLIASLWHTPAEFFRFWGGKLVPALFLASFVFLSKKNWWTIIANFIIDIWLIANMFYYKANSLFLSYETMKMADNMSGFWSSLYSYLGWDIYIFLVLSLVYILCFLPLKNIINHRSAIKFFSFFLFSIFLSVFDNICYAKVMNKWENTNEAIAQVHSQMLAAERFTNYYPFGHVVYYAVGESCVDYNAWSYTYVKDYSILSYFPATFIFNWLRPAGEIIPLSEADIQIIEPFFSQKQDSICPNSNLIFILFESMESWPLEEVCGYHFMPNLTALLNDPHVLYCDKLKSQVKHGNSADGQMIDATGLLPISNGAVCRLYADNKFAGYAECYPNAAIVNPAPGSWGQSKVTFGYQFKELIEPQRGEHWEDLELMKQMINYADTTENPFCVLGITVSSHVPFAYGSNHPKYTIDGMPLIMSAYLNCLHFTDSCIGELFHAVQTNEKLKDNTTIVISGDHTIFRSVNEEFDVFAQKNGINMQTTKTYTPLIIYSPNISKNMQVTDTCYQMDIYPTIMHLIGCEDYYWKGFGVNLMDSIARHNRPISEQEAYELSDKLIRSNYFAQ
ncbi:MAG: sulfatase-like hydrolase/transferase [Paludibacteraceae bacterium]|nr:sulfatase-like hydrolase/transferase [Paludibacteraceae bacterium]